MILQIQPSNGAQDSFSRHLQTDQSRSSVLFGDCQNAESL